MHFKEIFENVLMESPISSYENLMKKYKLKGNVLIYKDNKFHDFIESFQDGDMVNGYMVESAYYSNKDEHEKNDDENENMWQAKLIDAKEDNTWCEIAYKKGSSRDAGRYIGPKLCSLKDAENNIKEFLK